MKVLVTGASGFIGWHLCRALRQRDIAVTGLARSSSDWKPLEDLQVSRHVGSLWDTRDLAQLCAEHDVVFHLAGLVKSIRVAELYRVNADGTRSVLEAAASCSEPPIVVIVSSLAAVGPAIQQDRVEEDDCRPVSHYGRSKHAAEQVAQQWSDRLPISIVRPPIVFGEYDRGTLAMFRAVSWLGVHVVPGWNRKRFSLIHAADLADGLIRAADRGERLGRVATDAPGRGIYFVTGGTPVSYAKIGEFIGHGLGRRLTIPLPLPHATVWAMGAITQWAGAAVGRATALSIDKAREATAGSWTCSDQKVRQHLGFAPAADLPERFHQTAEWYRQQRWL